MDFPDCGKATQINLPERAFLTGLSIFCELATRQERTTRVRQHIRLLRMIDQSYPEISQPPVLDSIHLIDETVNTATVHQIAPHLFSREISLQSTRHPVLEGSLGAKRI